MSGNYLCQFWGPRRKLSETFRNWNWSRYCLIPLMVVLFTQKWDMWASHLVLCKLFSFVFHWRRKMQAELLQMWIWYPRFHDYQVILLNHSKGTHVQSSRPCSTRFENEPTYSASKVRIFISGASFNHWEQFTSKCSTICHFMVWAYKIKKHVSNY